MSSWIEGVNPIVAEIGVVFLLLIFNGFFAMSELAFVSARKGVLRQLANDKSRGAKLALEFVEDPTEFLSLVQIGMTLNSVLVGAFSGIAFTEEFGAYLNQFVLISPYGEPVALAITVAGVTYFNLVIGELVPKRIGMVYAESIAVKIAPLICFSVKVVAPVVWVLKISTDVMMKLLHLRNKKTLTVTEDEVKSLIAEGTKSGVFKPAEKNMLEGVMRLADRTVRGIMTPRIDVVWLSVEDSAEENAKIIRTSGYSRFPVASGDLEKVLGFVDSKDLLNLITEGKAFSIKEVMRPHLTVPDTTSVLRLVDQFKQSGQHMAVVVDEYGSVEGIVSVTDILEAITGDIPEIGEDNDSKPVKREDGSWLIDGMTPVDEVEALLGLKNMRNGEDFYTIAGFFIEKMGRIPLVGEHFHWGDARFEVVDMDAHRIDKVLIKKEEPMDF